MSLATYYVLVALSGTRLHGYAILEKVGELSDGELRLAVGTLYGALDRLVQRGLVQQEGEEVVAGRLRRYYTLTAKGAGELERQAASFRRAGRVGQAAVRAT